MGCIELVGGNGRIVKSLLSGVHVAESDDDMSMLVDVSMNGKNTDECVQAMTMLVDTEREKRVKGRRK